MTQPTGATSNGAVESRVAAALECSQDCVKLVSDDGNVRFFNTTGLCQMEIDDPTVVIGRPWADLWPEESRQAVREAFERARQTGFGEFQGRCPTAKGAEKWWDVVVTRLPVGPGGAPDFAVTSRDVTARREAEIRERESAKRLNTIFGAGADAIWDIDLLSDTVWWGEGMQSTFGYGPDQVGESTRWCHEHMHPDDRERVVRGMAAAIDSDALHWEDQFRYRKADGSYLEVLDRGSVIRDARGKAVRFVGVMQDNTQRKQEELRQGELNRELAHRINNTLAVVTGIFHNTVRTSSDLANFAETYGNRLLALSNANSVLVRGTLGGADLRELANVQLRPYMAQERIAIDGPPVALSLRVAQPLALALNELATNAIKYGALRSPRGIVTLRWKRVEHNGAQRLRIEWTERLDMPVSQPNGRKGLGTRLIEQGVPSATVQRTFTEHGLSCVIEISGDAIVTSRAVQGCA